MLYLGGKVLNAKHITQAILDHTTERLAYWEPFVGGGGMLVKAAPHFKHTYASDTHPDLILMYQAVQQGWLPPTEVSEELYQQLKAETEPSALRGAVGFGCSFSGKWFGGYARDPKSDRNFAKNARSSVLRDSKAWANTVFSQRSYADASPSPGLVIYCDPPYAGTTGYSTSKGFDHEHFWQTAQGWAESGSHVFVSEYNAPEGWTAIWEKPKRVTANGKGGHSTHFGVERLFTWG